MSPRHRHVATAGAMVVAAWGSPAAAEAPGPRAAAVVPSGTANDLPPDLPVTAEDEDWKPRVMGVGHDGGTLRAGEPGILFINFGGAILQSGCGDYSKDDCSRLSGQFGGEIYPYAPDQSGLRAGVVQAVRSDTAEFGLRSTDARPPASEDYAMVLVGDSAAGGSEDLGFAGVAPGIDCGNTDPNITSFALATSYTANGMATVINQEAAHTWGLEHVNKQGDNLYPTSGGVVDPQYTDECMRIVGDTMLNPTQGRCNSIHTEFCDADYQNSYQEMLYLFGPPIPDATAPTVTIEAPTEGATIEWPVVMDLVVDLQDDQSPQVMFTSIYLDGTLLLENEYAAGTQKFPINDPSGDNIAEGEHTIVVETQDESGNEATPAEVTFTVGQPTGGGDSGGTAPPGDTNAGDTDGGATDGETAPPGDTGAGDTTGGTDASDETGGTASPGGESTDSREAGCACAADSTPARPAPVPLLGLILLAAGRGRPAGPRRVTTRA